MPALIGLCHIWLSEPVLYFVFYCIYSAVQHCSLLHDFSAIKAHSTITIITRLHHSTTYVDVAYSGFPQLRQNKIP